MKKNEHRVTVPIFILLISLVFQSAQFLPSPFAAEDDILVADFERNDFENWQVSGEAFGSGPTRGALSGQGYASGYLGEKLANSHHGGKETKGGLTSPPFEIKRDYINFLIGGGASSRKSLGHKNLLRLWG